MLGLQKKADEKAQELEEEEEVLEQQKKAMKDLEEEHAPWWTWLQEQGCLDGIGEFAKVARAAKPTDPVEVLPRAFQEYLFGSICDKQN